MPPVISSPRRLAAATAAAVLALTLAPAAAAAPVAPGAPLRVAPLTPSVPGIPAEIDAFACSQGISGEVRHTDGTTQPIMLTAAHCVTSLYPELDFSPEVKVPKPDGDQRIGQRGATGGPMTDPVAMSSISDNIELFTSEDWAVVNLDPGVPTSRLSEAIDYQGTAHGEGVAMTGIRDYADVPAGQFRTDNFGQPICKDGSTSGRSCGIQLGRTQHSVFSWGLSYDNGDSGGNNFDPRTGEVIGVTSQGVGPFGRTQTADAALQAAYGIPDGRVNEHFTLPESTAPHDTDFRPLGQDTEAATTWFRDNGYTGEQIGPNTPLNPDPAAATVLEQYTDEVLAAVEAGDVVGALSTAEEALAAASQLR